MKPPGLKKLDEVYELLEREKLKGVLFFNSFECRDANVLYFSGFEGEAAIFISSRIVLLINPLHEMRKIKGIDEVIPLSRNNLLKIARSAKRIGINGKRIPLNVFSVLRKKAKLKDVHEFFEKLRSIKLKEEVSIIQKCCWYANKLIKKLKNLNFSKEHEICLTIKQFLAKNKLKEAFEPLVAFGKRSRCPHPIPAWSEGKAIEIGYVDFGICFKGYNCDVTLPFVGKKYEDMAEILVNAQKEVEERLRNEPEGNPAGSN